MVSLENLLLYIPLAALLVMLPGPDFALIVRTSLAEGRSSGQAAACGVALGIMVHTSAAYAGHQCGHRPVRHPVHAFALCRGRLSVLDGHPCPAGRA